MEISLMIKNPSTRMTESAPMMKSQLTALKTKSNSSSTRKAMTKRWITSKAKKRSVISFRTQTKCKTTSPSMTSLMSQKKKLQWKCAKMRASK